LRGLDHREHDVLVTGVVGESRDERLVDLESACTSCGTVKAAVCETVMRFS
jgi:hypothetical protein